MLKKNKKLGIDQADVAALRPTTPTTFIATPSRTHPLPPTHTITIPDALFDAHRPFLTRMPLSQKSTFGLFKDTNRYTVGLHPIGTHS